MKILAIIVFLITAMPVSAQLSDCKGIIVFDAKGKEYKILWGSDSSKITSTLSSIYGKGLTIERGKPDPASVRYSAKTSTTEIICEWTNNLKLYKYKFQKYVKAGSLAELSKFELKVQKEVDGWGKWYANQAITAPKADYSTLKGIREESYKDYSTSSILRYFFSLKCSESDERFAGVSVNVEPIETSAGMFYLEKVIVSIFDKDAKE